MNKTRRKISISLDEELIAELKTAGQSLSAQINAAVRMEIERRHRQRLLSEFLDQLDAEHGPVDKALVDKYTQLLA